MEYRMEIGKIKGEYLRGELTYEEARVRVEVLLVEMNKKAEKVAKEFGKKKPNKLTFEYVFR